MIIQDEVVNKVVSELEHSYNIKFVYVCNQGSQAWGYSSSKSDRDLRGVFIHKPEVYLSLYGSHSSLSHVSKEHNIDFLAYDLKKFLMLFYKSNPQIVEWSTAMEVYKDLDGEFQDALIGLLTRMRYYNPIAMFHHHTKLAKSHYMQAQEEPERSLKLYLTALRSKLSALWTMDNYLVPPPHRLDHLMNLLRDIFVPDSTIQIVNSFIEQKRSGAIIPSWIDEDKERIDRFLSTDLIEPKWGFRVTPEVKPLDDLILTLLRRVWDE